MSNIPKRNLASGCHLLKKLINLHGGQLDVTTNIYLKSCAYHPDSECCTFFHGNLSNPKSSEDILLYLYVIWNMLKSADLHETILSSSKSPLGDDFCASCTNCYYGDCVLHVVLPLTSCDFSAQILSVYERSIEVFFCFFFGFFLFRMRGNLLIYRKMSIYRLLWGRPMETSWRNTASEHHRDNVHAYDKWPVWR